MNKTQKVELWALMSKEPNGEWNIVGLAVDSHHLPLVSSREMTIRKMLPLVEPSVRARSKILKFTGEVYL